MLKLSCLLDVKCLSFRTNDYRTRIAGSANRECHILCQIQLTICVPRTVVSLVSVTDRYSPTGKMKEREIVDLVDLCSWKTSQLPPSTKFGGGCHIHIPYPPSSHTHTRTVKDLHIVYFRIHLPNSVNFLSSEARIIFLKYVTRSKIPIVQ